MKRKSGIALLLAAVCLAATQPTRAQLTTNLPVTADNSIIDVDGERDFNMGAASQIRLKVFQHHLIFKFDTSALPHTVVTSARLRFYENNSPELNHVTISTIQADWNEGSSGGFATSEGGSCFNHSRWSATTNNRVPWAWPGSKFADVAYGNAFSLVSHADTQYGNDGTSFYEWPVDPDLIAANLVGASHGLAVFESSRDVSQNRTVYSREQASLRPQVIITGTNQTILPGAIADLTASTSGVDRGEVRLTWTTPTNAFAYRAWYSGPVAETPVPRHLIPFAGAPGQTDGLLVRDILLPGRQYTFSIEAVSRSGHASARASTTIPASDIERIPALNTSYPPASACASVDGYSNALLRVWAVPETEKILPAGGFLSADSIPAGYPTANPVFDGVTIRLHAARNETVACLLALEAVSGPVSNLAVTLSLPPAGAGPAGALSRIGYIQTAQGYMPELVYPHTNLYSTRMDENASASQKIQQVLVELQVPAGAAAGPHTLSIGVTNDAGVAFAIPLELNVRDFALPATPGFDLEMNDYGFPTYLATFNRLQQLARWDRAHVNLVHYGTTRTRMDMILPGGAFMNEAAYTTIAPDATTTDWSDFIAAFNPAFTGSLFTNSPWAGVPIRGFYLSFHESFPLRHDSYRTPGEPDARKAFTSHPEYARTFVNILSNFVDVARAQSWTHAGFQVYFNNKQNPWDFDEPYDFWDFRALGWYADLHRQAMAGNTNIPIQFRVDISRPQYQRKQLDGRVDLAVVGRDFFTYHRLVNAQADRDGTEVWNYGTAAEVHKSNHNGEAWPLLALAFGANGIIPWSTVKYVDGTHNYLAGITTGDEQQRALYIVKTDGQSPVVYSTLRMKAFRRGGQDCDYLELARRAGGYTRGQMSRLIIDTVGDSATIGINPGYVEDAGTIEFQGLSASRLHALRMRAARIIEGRHTPRIAEISLAPDTLTLGLDNVYTGISCKIERALDLSVPDWQVVSNFAAARHALEWSTPFTGAPARAFYRFQQTRPD